MPVILVVGSLIPIKGVDLIIRALSQCKSSVKWKLIIVGTGAEEDKLKVLVSKKGLEDQVRFVGQVAPDAIAVFLAKSDILVQASYREGRPNAVLEAMAAAKAVVGSNIDGINELIDHQKNGLLFTAGDVEELSSCLDMLLESPGLRQKFGKEARRSLLDKNLTWSSCAQSYMQIYRNLVNMEA